MDDIENVQTFLANVFYWKKKNPSLAIPIQTTQFRKISKHRFPDKVNPKKNCNNKRIVC